MSTAPTAIKPGDSVTVRRWIQPGLKPGHPDRELAVEYSGVIGDMADGLVWMDEAEGGFFCPDEVFLGGQNVGTGGQSYYLVTEVIPDAVA